MLSCQTSMKKGETDAPGSSFISPSLKSLLDQQQILVKQRNADSAIRLGKQIREKAAQVSDTLAIARSILVLNEDSDATGQEEIVGWLRNIIPFLERQGLVLETIQAQVMLSSYLSANGNYEASQALIIPAWKAADKHGYRKLLPKIGLTIANNFSGIGEPNQAIAYLQASTQIARELKDSAILPSLLMNIGIWHFEQKSDSANHYYKQALASIPAGRGDFMRMKVLYNMAVELETAGKYDEAAIRYQEMAANSERQGQFEALAVAYKGLGSLYRTQGKLAASKQYLERSIQWADSIKQSFLKLQGMIELQYTFEAMGAYKEALQTSMKVMRVRDSIFAVEKKVAIIELEQKYQTEKKEVENQSLMKLLSAEKRFNWALSFILICSIPFVISLYQRKKFQQERNRSYEALIERYQQERKEASARRDSVAPTVVETEVIPVDPSENYLSETEMAENRQMLETIRHLIESERLYLNSQLRQEDLAEKLSITPRRLSAYLRWSNPPGFYALLNEYRVRESRQLLESPQHAHLKLDAIGQMAGFSNRQNFNKVFEQLTGLTPGYYRKKMS